MKEWIDYYETLQVHPKAGKEVIEAAYGKLMSLGNPGYGDDPYTKEQIERIDLAFEVLMDDNRRKIFHEDWLKNVKTGKSEEENIHFKRKRQATKEDLKACNCLNLYYGCLERRDFSAAYKYVSLYEKDFIREKDFLEWQEAAVEIIEISDIKIREFKKHRNFESRPGRLHYNAYEFEVSLLEKSNATGKISRNSFTRMVIKENDEYCVLLGHDNLRPIINKLRVMAEMKDKKDAVSRFQEYDSRFDPVTGIMNKRGFLEEAKKEEARFNRYGRVFSILFIDCKDNGGISRKDELMQFVIGIIRKNIRNLDMFAIWGENAFVLLLPETGNTEAEAVAEKLKLLFEDQEICVGSQVVKVRLRTGVSEYNKHSLVETIYKAQVEKKTGVRKTRHIKSVV